jgi:hypothetical protein
MTNLIVKLDILCYQEKYFMKCQNRILCNILIYIINGTVLFVKSYY